MRRWFSRALLVLALLIIFGGHITDSFNWDHTFQSGNEIDYTIAVVVAVGAVVLLAAGSGIVGCWLLPLPYNPAMNVESNHSHGLPFTPPTASPPLPLRI